MPMTLSHTLGHQFRPLVPVTDNAGDIWRPLRYFNLYRSVLSGLFVVLVVSGTAPRFLGQHAPELFLMTAILYMGFSVACSFTIRWRRPPFSVQIFAQVMADIVAITLMMYASGGVGSGLGVLLVVAIAGGSILTVGRIALLFAAIGAVAILGQEVYAWAYQIFPDTAYTHSGILGVTFFATAFLAHVLADRLRRSEALALQRGLDLADLSVLNEHIIQRMQSGIVALDSEDRVRLINGSAKRLLAIGGPPADGPLRRFSQDLAKLVARWRANPTSTSHVFRPAGTGTDVIASFATLPQPNSPGALVFLEDSSAVTDRAQRLKLASLGRLTASIAHEIRNPLGAISHAGQLLAESPQLGESDRRLTQIIKDHSYRVNAIIENVMQLSRRRTPAPASFELGDWLVDFIQEFAGNRGLDAKDLCTEVAKDDVQVRMDPVQLHQVLTNLCENGLRYSTDRPYLTLRAGVMPEAERPYLDVYDTGAGVSPDVADHLFEPFFTTAQEGTGLGLYIARDMCEVNHASLSHLGQTERGHCFRIIFAHPRRQGVPVP